jgi:hypothetical protein
VKILKAVLARPLRTGEMNMTGNAYNVVMAGYVKVDAATMDFDRLVKAVEEKGYQNLRGRDPRRARDGRPCACQGCRGPSRAQRPRLRGGVGLVAGLFAPPLLSAVAVGAAAGGMIGKFTKHRIETGIEKKVGEAVPAGWAGVITLVDAAEPQQ